MDVRQVFLIVLDSYGIGHAPDAADFGDEGNNTLKTITSSPKYSTPNMCKMGLLILTVWTAVSRKQLLLARSEG